VESRIAFPAIATSVYVGVLGIQDADTVGSAVIEFIAKRTDRHWPGMRVLVGLHVILFADITPQDFIVGPIAHVIGVHVHGCVLVDRRSAGTFDVGSGFELQALISVGGIKGRRITLGDLSAVLDGRVAPIRVR